MEDEAVAADVDTVRVAAVAVAVVAIAVDAAGEGTVTEDVLKSFHAVINITLVARRIRQCNSFFASPLFLPINLTGRFIG